MSWDERQRRMLAAMGLRVWARPDDGGGEAVETAVALEPAQQPKPVMAAEPAEPESTAVSLMQALPAELRRPLSPATPIAPAVARPAEFAPAAADARLAAIAAMDWSALQFSVSECRACVLCEGRRGPEDTVFGSGQAPVQCLVVGDMPGEQELAEGLPFAGQSGQLLGNMLRALGLNPSESAGQVALLNALKCRSTPGRNPGVKELQHCEPYLQRQIELLQPQLILALGRMAVQSLLQTQEPLGRLRGRVHRYRAIPVIVSFPPSYLLRNPAEKARAWADLCLAQRHMTKPGPRA